MEIGVHRYSLRGAICRFWDGVPEEAIGLRNGGGFRPGVKIVNLLAIAFFDDAAAQLERWRHDSVVWGEFVGNQQNPLQLFKAREILEDG